MTDLAAAAVCPKCGYARTATDTAPAWQCPACGIAYQKYKAYLEHARKAVTPPRADDTPPHFVLDGSVWSLIVANVLVLYIARVQGWSTYSLMMVYWSQSVIIGFAHFFRIRTLENFSTEGVKLNDHSVEPTDRTKRQVAGFFALHYGFFHACYLDVMLESAGKSGEHLFTSWFWVCAAIFAVNQIWSFHYHRDLDRRGVPNIGTLMFIPYWRLVPMPLTMFFGDLLAAKAASFWLFGGVRTVVDVLMHRVEHAPFRKVRDDSPVIAD